VFKIDRFKLWKAKRIHKRIMKYEDKLESFKFYVKKCKEWIKRDKKDLQKQLRKMDEIEVIKFGIDTGYLEKDKKY